MHTDQSRVCNHVYDAAQSVSFAMLTVPSRSYEFPRRLPSCCTSVVPTWADSPPALVTCGGRCLGLQSQVPQSHSLLGKRSN